MDAPIGMEKPDKDTATAVSMALTASFLMFTFIVIPPCFYSEPAYLPGEEAYFLYSGLLPAQQHIDRISGVSPAQ